MSPSAKSSQSHWPWCVSSVSHWGAGVRGSTSPACLSNPSKDMKPPRNDMDPRALCALSSRERQHSQRLGAGACRHWTCQSLDCRLPSSRTVKLLLPISHAVSDSLLEQSEWTNPASKVVPTTVLFSSTFFLSDSLFSTLSSVSQFYKFSVSPLPLLSQLFFHLTSRWSRTETKQINTRPSSEDDTANAWGLTALQIGFRF